MAREKKHKSKQKWLDEHNNDEYVKRARDEGWRSRAVFKLIEIDDKDRLLKRGTKVVDLGAAPGGWSQVAAKRVGPEGRVIALDILPMDEMRGVEFLQGDFQEQEVFDNLINLINDDAIDLVISDMAPSISGIDSIDQPRSMYLTELARDLADSVLAPGGDLLMKVFQGEGFDEFVRDIRRLYTKVVIRKPKASRPRSREVYLLARGKR